MCEKAMQPWFIANPEKPKRASPICWKNLFGFILFASLPRREAMQHDVSKQLLCSC